MHNVTFFHSYVNKLPPEKTSFADTGGVLAVIQLVEHIKDQLLFSTVIGCFRRGCHSSAVKRNSVYNLLLKTHLCRSMTRNLKILVNRDAGLFTVCYRKCCWGSFRKLPNRFVCAYLSIFQAITAKIRWSKCSPDLLTC